MVEKVQFTENPHHTGFLLLLDEMYGEEEVEVQVDLVGGLHVLLELVGGGQTSYLSGPVGPAVA